MGIIKGIGNTTGRKKIIKNVLCGQIGKYGSRLTTKKNKNLLVVEHQNHKSDLPII